MTDDRFRVRFALTMTPDAGHLYLKPDAEGGWQEFARIDPVDAMTTHPVGFDKSGDRYYLLDSRGRDKGALKAVDVESGAEELLAESELADIDGALIHPTEKNVQAVSFNHTRREWQILDPAVKPDLDYLAGCRRRRTSGDKPFARRPALDGRVYDGHGSGPFLSVRQRSKGSPDSCLRVNRSWKAFP